MALSVFLSVYCGKRYGKSVDEISHLNSLKQNQPIKPGQKLMIAQIQR